MIIIIKKSFPQERFRTWPRFKTKACGNSEMAYYRPHYNQEQLFNNYSIIFTDPEKKNCFSVITQVIIRTIAFSFILFVSVFKNIKKSRCGHFENIN